ncbi:MAG: sodium:solute symporter family protein [Bacteroidota bacterium]
MSSIAYPIDVGILVAFLAINLVVGLSYGRRVKDLKAYALGGKNFSTGTLAATIVATVSSGSGLFIDLENTYSNGLYYIIAIIGLPIGLWLSGQLAIRMGEFLNNVSVAEAMGDVYGKTVQIITAISGIIAKTGLTAVQFKAIATMLSILFNFDSISTTLAAASIVIIYSTLGGIRSVTFTDVIQFFTFGTIIPILALVIWSSIQDPNQVIITLTNNPNFNIKQVVRWNPQFRATLGLLLYFVIPHLYTPQIFQRIAMARGTRQVKDSLTYAAGILLLVLLLTAWVSILLLTDRPGLAPGQIVPYLIQHHAYTGLRGLLGVGIMALAMSTADSCLNACSVLFANDIVKPLSGHTAGSIKVAKSFSFVIGFAAVLLALYSSDLLSLVLLSGSFYMPIFTVPMLLAVLGFRSTKRAVLVGMAAGFMMVVLWSIFFKNSTSIAPGMLANLIGLVGTHYLLGEKGGWQQTDPNNSSKTATIP